VRLKGSRHRADALHTPLQVGHRVDPPLLDRLHPAWGPTDDTDAWVVEVLGGEGVETRGAPLATSDAQGGGRHRSATDRALPKLIFC